MIEGFKNREVAARRGDCSYYQLSERSQHELAVSGMITPEEAEDTHVLRERLANRERLAVIENIIGAEYYQMSRAGDSVPVYYFINMEHGTIEVINFSDLMLARCKEEADTDRLLERIVSRGFKAERAGDYVRVKYGKYKDNKNFKHFKPITVI